VRAAILPVLTLEQRHEQREGEARKLYRRRASQAEQAASTRPKENDWHHRGTRRKSG
jgi:low affinity Fe/Cu permease